MVLLNRCLSFHRLLAIPFFILLTWIVFDYFVMNAGRSNSAVAYKLDPTNPFVLTLEMNKRLSTSPIEISGTDYFNISRAILADPMNRVLLRTAAIHYELAGRMDRAAYFMRLGDQVSRRDPIGQMWLAEYAIQMDQPLAAITHFSNATTVRPQMQRALFPRMIGLMVNDDRGALGRYLLKRKSYWSPAFFEAAANAEPAITSKIFRDNAESIDAIWYQIALEKIVMHHAKSGGYREVTSFLDELFPYSPSAGIGQFGSKEVDRKHPLGQFDWKWIAASKPVDASVPDDAVGFYIDPSLRVDIGEKLLFVEPNDLYSGVVDLFGNSERFPAGIALKAECSSRGSDVPIFSEYYQIQPNLKSIDFEFRTVQSCYLVRFSITALGSDGQAPNEIFLRPRNLKSILGRRPELN